MAQGVADPLGVLNFDSSANRFLGARVDLRTWYRGTVERKIRK